VELMREGRGVRHTPRHTPGRAPRDQHDGEPSHPL
jgi:hypothetical protein